MEKNLQEIVKIDKECFSEFWSIEKYSKLKDQENYQIHKRYVKGKVVAFAISLDMIDVLELIRIGVDKDHRHKGYAKELIKEIEEKAVENKIGNIFLEVRSKNVAAISLYKNQNFKIVSTRKNYYSDNMDDALVMRKRIGDKHNEEGI